MALTKAQKELLLNLKNGWEVTYKDGHYVTVKDGKIQAKLWPSTFYGLYNARLVEKMENGNYTVSRHGKKQVRS